MWNDKLKYGEIFLQNEIEQSKYNFEVSDAKALFTMFDLYQKEVDNCINAKLVLPAYDYVLKHAGATITCRDIVDERVIEEVKTGIPYYEKKLPKDAYGDLTGLSPKSMGELGFPLCK